MTSSQRLNSNTTSDDGCSLPIPVWTEQEEEQQHRQPHDPTPSTSASKQPLVSDDGLHPTTVRRKPLVSDDGLQVVVRKPVPVPVPAAAAADGLHAVDDYNESAGADLPPPYETAPASGRCIVLPSRAAEWRVKGAGRDGVRLCTLAAAVLVRERVLDGADIELLRIHDERKREEEEAPAAAEGDTGTTTTTTPRDPMVPLKLSTFSSVSSVRRGASEASLRSYRRKLHAAHEAGRQSGAVDQQQQQQQPSSAGDGTTARGGSISRASSTTTTTTTTTTNNNSSDTGRVPSSSSASLNDVGESTEVARVAVKRKKKKRTPNAEEQLDRFAEGVASSGKGVARIVGAGLAAPGVYAHELARGFHNAPRLYGDETVRRDAEIVGFTSGLAAAGKGFGYGLYDGITGFFVQPVRGAQKEGTKGFVKGFVKGVGGVVCKPAAGGFGVAGHTLVGIQRSIEKSISRKPSEEEAIAVASVWQGEEEMQSLTDQEKREIVEAWLAGSR